PPARVSGGTRRAPLGGSAAPPGPRWGRGGAPSRPPPPPALPRRYAVLAAELVLAGTTADDATAIDRLCAERDRALHACAAGDTACVPSLPWSRCVAALVWFVGGGP